MANTGLENLFYYIQQSCKMGLVVLPPHPGVLEDQMHPRLFWYFSNASHGRIQDRQIILIYTRWGNTEAEKS